MPPIKSRIYEFAFVNAYNEPIHIIFENMVGVVKSIEKIINSIKATNDWSKSKDNRDLNHDLKNQAVEELINVINANGLIKINTFNITYLKEYVNIRFRRFMEIKLLRSPSNENTFKSVSLVVIILFNFNINSEKLMLHLNMFSPTSLIAKDMRELMFINCSIKKYDEFDNIAKINNLNINWNGCSVSVEV